jgi:hypothetical protein
VKGDALYKVHLKVMSSLISVSEQEIVVGERWEDHRNTPHPTHTSIPSLPYNTLPLYDHDTDTSSTPQLPYPTPSYHIQHHLFFFHF